MGNASGEKCRTESSRHTPCAVADGTRSVPSMSSPASRPPVIFSFSRFSAPLGTYRLRFSPGARLDGLPMDWALATTLISSRVLCGFVECHDRRNRSPNSTPFPVSPLASLPPSPSPRPSLDRGEAKVKVGGKTLLSSPSRALTLHLHLQFLPKTL
jgi:hypothetical protein